MFLTEKLELATPHDTTSAKCKTNLHLLKAGEENDNNKLWCFKWQYIAELRQKNYTKLSFQTSQFIVYISCNIMI